ncbi:hypothetical protein C7T94_00010 [Pedobacter yulinensis]|uniref:SAM-dependent MTase RsmB/NOP-type domain-containing protein n=1 Tax=Pedobacter yulinensis TaxID=2126353 RepID=A0A2T3HQ43_9SPHI|nr:hypothetical protein [Pedobacter yulinensis]PST84562.1 hypothetical protein C7T94_00010 [Pedobacter yulinensis]
MPQLPGSLIEQLKDLPHFNASAFLAAHEVEASPIVSIRSNPFKPASLPFQGTPITWNAEGLYLAHRPSFTFDPLFHAGCYYVQEASSMFLRQALETIGLPAQPIVLDLCAAPGGKSTLISSFLQQEGLLVANEIIKTRVNVLADNLDKWGPANTIVTNNDPRDFSRLPACFDLIVADAPCSGSGMFRKDPAAINEWSEDNVRLCSQRQQRILADVYPALKQGGWLIYSTCSYSEAENEQVVDWLMDTFSMESIRLPQFQGIVETTSAKKGAFGYRFYPGAVPGEGFFIACLRKTGEENSRSNRKQTDRSAAGKPDRDLLKPWIKNEKLQVFRFNDDLYAFPEEHYSLFQQLRQSLYIKKSGVKLGRTAGRDLLPDHQLGLSLLAAPGIPRFAVDKETALEYLRRNDISLQINERGWGLVTYDGYPLGWVKALPNRVNNYFPKELRILRQS